MTGSTMNHAPSHLREQFQEWLDSYEPNRLQQIDIRPVASLLDVLADCSDVLPADYCDQLEIPNGSTYARAVEEVRQWCAKQQKTQSKRSAEDVYWEYVERVGDDACTDAVISYFDRLDIVEILLERIDVDDSDEFLNTNVVVEAL